MKFSVKNIHKGMVKKYNILYRSKYNYASYIKLKSTYNVCFNNNHTSPNKI